MPKKEGLGLYKQEIFDGKNAKYLLEWWLVASGMIKVAVGQLEGNQAHYLGKTWHIVPVIYREFSAEKHDNYYSMYMHVVSYIGKLKRDWQYLEEEKRSNPPKSEDVYRVQIPDQTTDIDHIFAAKVSKIGKWLLDNGVGFDLIVDMVNAIRNGEL